MAGRNQHSPPRGSHAPIMAGNAICMRCLTRWPCETTGVSQTTGPSFSPDQPVTWLHQPRGGYGYTIPVDGHVVRLAGQHVIVRVPLKSGRLVERRVRPENLRPRGEGR